MKSLIILGVISLVGSSFVTTAAFAQKSKREQVVATCIAKGFPDGALNLHASRRAGTLH